MANSLIRSVDGAECPCPSAFTWGLQDVSDSDSGRLLDGNATMQKNRITQKRKLNLVWNGLTPEVTAQVLTMFNPEYINVTYWDSMDGAEETREFYVGDRSTPVQQWFANSKLYQQVAFNIIER